ncbi:DNA-binding MurR/RpiR family transcriptional regulator [Evansella vedderi]|uniref:DNA-binding MurR/RpiR family transcriptional regulator n=1 Tax=Evansella vedderi TaxID=38282 RepID=A0ABT9ZSF9_9BACI|nr:MurR/RpiR family transcriptional regulator [Evansella vedderi]MDQ0254152.1 DNA-binding MurR/RpiR family transcriptional regulator [Evansella vedderi]
MRELNVNDNPGFFSRIDVTMAKLRASELKIVEFIKENREEIIHLSITEVAERSNTSESSVVRLCKRLGYKGFQDLKIHLAKEVMTPEKVISNDDIEKEDNITTIKQKIFQSNIQVLYDSLEVLKEEELEKAVNALLNANLIEIYGTGASGVVTKDAQHKLLKLGVKVITYSDSILQTMSASLLNKGDVVLGISHTGSNRDVLNAMKLAKETGATLICITNASKSPMTKISDIILHTAAKETLYRTDAVSRIAQLTTIDILVAAITNQRHEYFTEVLEKTKRSTVGKKL